MIVGLAATFVMFAGLVLAMPKQAKAEPAPPEYPKTVIICCPDGNCHYCLCDSEECEDEWYKILCGCTSPGDPGQPDV